MIVSCNVLPVELCECSNSQILLKIWFHVVFCDDYQKVVVYNNMAKLVKGPTVLLEDH